MISAIGVLDSNTLKKILGNIYHYRAGIGEWKNAEGAFMVRFKKYGKDLYVITDSRFPSVGGDEWLLGE